MRTMKKRVSSILLGLGLALSSLTPAFADDSEIYVGAITTVKPNILFIIDTSMSMDASDVNDDHATFSPTGSYGSNSGNCNGSYNRIFFTTGTGATPPTCASTNYIRTDAGWQTCDKLAKATASAASAPSGRWTGKAAQYNATNKAWEDLKTGGQAQYVECAADNGIHGIDAANASKYPRNGQATASAAWSGSASAINWSQYTTYTFYSERWVRWNAQPATTVNLKRLRAVQNSVLDMVSSIDDVNIGVMRFNGENTGASNNTDPEYQGGVITNAVADVTTERANIIDKVNGFTVNSGTPLSETLREAGRYWAGQKIKWGKTTGLDTNATSSSDTYKSPITESCQRNFNILLTDGRPTWDNQDDADITALYGGACTGQPGDTTLGPSTGTPASRANAGRCLDEMSSYLARDTTDLLDSMTGKQRVKTFTIGFGPTSDQPALNFLTEVATDGGGVRYLASNTDQLSAALTAIATEISNISSTFATASIGVNSFNRAASRDDLYFAVFNSDDHLRWDGNLKKYKLATTEDPDGTGPLQPKLIISGDTGGAAVDAVDSTTGFFKDGTKSFWSASADGNKVTEGGAANKLPTTRKVLTHIGANPAGSFEDMVAIDATAVTSTILDTVSGTPTRADVLAFAKSTSPKRMGDPLHSQPSVVTYGGTATDPTDVVFVGTNDGYLHAVDAKTGVEKWAFVPQELLPRLKTLVVDPSATQRSYGLDGDVRILRLDKDSDGIIESADGDLVWLFMGMRRGGKYYYALDVTNPDTPKLMWKDGPGVLADVGETWSPPTVARVAVSDKTQNNQKLVLIFGGGYDSVQENYVQVNDTSGNNIFMVDAKSGALLWSAGNNTSHDLNLAAMGNSIPGRISVLDTNSDGFADRMYAADLGGRIFRFDIFSGKDSTALVTGSVFAKLGNGLVTGASASPAAAANTRRFYNAPDVALIQRRGSDPYYNIAIGSGYRGHPLHKPALDRFYSLRDKQPFAKFSANNALTPITEATTGLVTLNATNAATSTVATSAPGWMFVFDPTGTATTATGEKVLNEATTVNGVVLFTSYIPQAASSDEPCRPTSINRVYALRVDNGRPALDLNNDGLFTNADLYESVIHEGILGGVNVGVLRGTIADALGGTSTVCLAGMHVLGKCVNVSDSVRTYWRRDVDQP